jgi:predicted Zn-dependent protease
MKVVAMAPSGRSGYSAQTDVASGALDPEGLARRASGKAVAKGAPLRLPAGEHPVVLEPPAVAELLWVLARVAFDGLAHAEGRGALQDRMGTRVVSPAVNISDSPRYGSTLPRSFDAEGVPKGPLPLIQDGIAHQVVHNTRSAALAGAESTGHARTAADSGRAFPTNLVMAGGGAANEDELCAGIERGIYVTRLWYTNMLRPAKSLFTTVTRDGTFLIEDGQVTRPLADMRVTDSALEILSRVEALGAHSVLTSDGELYGRRFAYGTVCPPLRASAMRFTGSADA